MGLAAGGEARSSYVLVTSIHSKAAFRYVRLSKIPGKVGVNDVIDVHGSTARLVTPKYKVLLLRRAPGDEEKETLTG